MARSSGPGMGKPQISPLRCSLSKIKPQPPDFEWVGGPGLDFETWVSPEKSVLPEHPGLKSETWATHSIFVRTIFIFLGGPKAHDLSGGMTKGRVVMARS